MPLIIVKPLQRLNLNKVYNITEKAKSIILTTKGRTNLKLTLERDGFNHPETALAMRCEIDNRMNESDVKDVKIRLVKNLKLRERPVRALN
jgi:hypothetical protein